MTPDRVAELRATIARERAAAAELHTAERQAAARLANLRAELARGLDGDA